jgi:hypothetical protein
MENREQHAMRAEAVVARCRAPESASYLRCRLNMRRKAQWEPLVAWECGGRNVGMDAIGGIENGLALFEDGRGLGNKRELK